ncbi:MAG TPA: shikimate dehydrogenase [Terriglobia bacterium]|nr:shikimate dehydrogenase [Terriglobia bacterium]
MAKPNSPHIYVSLAAPTLSAIEALAIRVSGVPVGYELRLDYLRDFSQFESRLHQMLMRLHFPQTIATCRLAMAGGMLRGTLADQAAILSAAVRAGCQWVDVEVESVRNGGVALFRELRPAKIIVSYHDFQKTPPLASTYRRMMRMPVQVVKIATQARYLRDNLQIRRLLKAHRRSNPRLVALAMGAPGIPSRLLSLLWGSAFTYAAPLNYSPAAAGQIPAEVMRSVYRVERLDSRTQLYGVLGSHASISLSPAMQNAAFLAKHVNAVFLPCQTSKLADFLAFARGVELQGFAVTMPFKRAILRALDWVDPLANRIGACNTVALQRGRWLGWNTDAAAVVEVLTKRLRLAGSRILILGAGGAARGAAYAVRAEGAEVIITARREATARALARGVAAQVVPWDSAESLEVDAVINATPVGMYPHVDTAPIDLARLRVRVVFDMVYFPLGTRFLNEARGRGLTTISGLEMLVAQGARQFEIWTGLAAPRALMEQAVRSALDHSGGG